MKIVLRITENGRTAVVRKSSDTQLTLADVEEAYFKAAGELNLSTEPPKKAKRKARSKKKVGNTPS